MGKLKSALRSNIEQPPAKKCRNGGKKKVNNVPLKVATVEDLASQMPVWMQKKGMEKDYGIEKLSTVPPQFKFTCNTCQWYTTLSWDEDKISLSNAQRHYKGQCEKATQINTKLTTWLQ